MGRTSTPPLPALARILEQVGQNIRLARQRRGLTAAMVAERAGMSPPTLRAIEKGEFGVTIGAIANVLLVLGLENDLALLGQSDPLGRKLADAALQGGRVRPRSA